MTGKGISDDDDDNVSVTQLAIFCCVKGECDDDFFPKKIKKKEKEKRCGDV